MCEHTFVLSSNCKGAIAEAEIAAAAIRLGIPVLKPLAEHGRYDLAFGIAGRILRVQCKWASLDQNGDVVWVRLQTSSCTPSGYVNGTYGQNVIDLVGAYCDQLDRCYLLPGWLIAARRRSCCDCRRLETGSVRPLTLQPTSSFLGL